MEQNSRGSARTGRTRRYSRRTGASRETGWAARLSVPNPYSVTVDARDLARYVGNRLLRHYKKALSNNVTASTGAPHDEPKRNRVLMGRRGLIATGEPDDRWPEAARYLHAAMRRTWQGKNYPRGGRWTNQKKAHNKIYFSPNGRSGRGGYPNPAASWNKFQDLVGMPNLDLDGAPDGLVEDAMNQWLEDVLSGDYLGVDTYDEAFGRTFR